MNLFVADLTMLLIVFMHQCVIYFFVWHIKFAINLDDLTWKYMLNENRLVGVYTIMGDLIFIIFAVLFLPSAFYVFILPIISELI